MQVTIAKGFCDGRVVKIRRESQGLSQEGLAEKAGLGVRTVIKFEQATPKDPVDARVSSLEAIGRVLGIEFLIQPRHPEVTG